MSNLNFSVDMGRVQSSVQAAIRPAIESALADIDLKKMIAAALKNPLVDDPYLIDWMVRGGRASKATLLDSMIQEGIKAIAQEYVTHWIGECRGEIEEAFRKMMTGSSNRLVKTFAAATERALKEDWSFELNVEVNHTTKDSNDD